MAEEYREASRRVVHEVNNPLSIIKNYLSVLDSKLARQEPVATEMSVLNEEIDRVGQLIGSLAELKPQESGPRPLDVNKVVDDVVRLFRAGQFVPGSVQIVTAMGEDARLVEGDADLLKQILVNLVKNAVEALGRRQRRPHRDRQPRPCAPRAHPVRRTGRDRQWAGPGAGGDGEPVLGGAQHQGWRTPRPGPVDRARAGEKTEWPDRLPQRQGWHRI